MVVRRLPSNSELYHHGIKGQHWGVKNGPPYPLDQKVSKRIKSGKNENRYEGKKVGIPHSAAASGTYYTRSINDIKNMSWEEFHKQPESYKRQFRDTDLGLKEVNKFEYGPDDWHFSNPLEHDDVKSLFNSNFKDEEYSKDRFFTIDERLKRSINNNGFYDNLDAQDYLKRINRGYYTDSTPDCKNNCSKCSDMVELLQRGLNPSNFTAGRSKFGMLSSATQYHWDGAIPYKEKSYENIEKRIKTFGNKGSGVISIRRSDGSGHAMHFSVVKNGRIEVQDGQTGKVYFDLAQALRAQAHDPNQFCQITRLDCATPNVNHMLEDSVIRMNKSEWQSGIEFKNGRAWIGDRNNMSSISNIYGDIDEEKSRSYRNSSTGRTFRYNG